MTLQQNDRHNHETKSTTRGTRNHFLAAALMVVSASAVALGNGGGGGGTGSSPVIPAPLAGKATFVDWDLPVLGAGECPSAIGAITLRPIDTPAVIDPVYYVTLCPQLQDPLNPTHASVRHWSSFEPRCTPARPSGARGISARVPRPASSTRALGDPFENPPAITGGMRLSSTNRVFVRTQSEILRLDFTASPVKITRFADTRLDTDPAAQSDVALVNRSGGYTDVWSAHNSQTLNPGTLAVPPTAPILSPVPPGIVQRLTVANSSNTATVTRYAVDGGAGLHYLSGIVSFQGQDLLLGRRPDDGRRRDAGNSIGVLDPDTGRRAPLLTEQGRPAGHRPPSDLGGRLDRHALGRDAERPHRQLQAELDLRQRPADQRTDGRLSDSERPYRSARRQPFRRDGRIHADRLRQCR